MDIDYLSQTSRIKIYKLLFLSILIIILNINFLHVEVYDNPNEIQGNLNNALISQPILDWNLPSEPWTFLIDSNQIISSKFEGFISEDELLIHLKSLN